MPDKKEEDPGAPTQEEIDNFIILLCKGMGVKGNSKGLSLEEMTQRTDAVLYDPVLINALLNQAASAMLIEAERRINSTKSAVSSLKDHMKKNKHFNN